MPESTPITLSPPPVRPAAADDAVPHPHRPAARTAPPPRTSASGADAEDAELTSVGAESEGAVDGASLPPASGRRVRTLRATLARLRRELLRIARELEALRAGPLREGDASAEAVERAMRLRFHQGRLVARLQAVESQGLLALSARRLVDPVALVRSAALEVEAELRRRGARLVLDLSGDGALVWLDAEQLLEALGCLLDDAVCHADAGGTVALHAHTADAYLTVTVQDDRRRAAWKATDPALLAAQLLAASDGELRRRSAPGLVEAWVLVPMCRSHARSRDAA